MRGIMVYCDSNGEEIRQVSLLKLPIKEEKIREESIRLYDEEEPCIIYRTTIINRVGIELLPNLEKLDIKNNLMNLEDVKGIVGDILDLPKEVKAIKFI